MNKKGMQQERNLVKFLNNKGYVSFRVPGSGGGTNRPLPDVMAGNGKNHYAIEFKSSNGDYIHIPSKKIYNLRVFCEGFGAIPIVCAKFSYLNYFFIHIDKLRYTKDLNYKISREQVMNSKSSYFC